MFFHSDFHRGGISDYRASGTLHMRPHKDRTCVLLEEHCSENGIASLPDLKTRTNVIQIYSLFTQ